MSQTETLSRVRSILENNKVKSASIDAIMSEISSLIVKSKRESFEFERVNEETQEQEIYCRDFQKWLLREFGSFDKDNKYQHFSKLATRLLNQNKARNARIDKEAMILLLANDVEAATKLAATKITQEQKRAEMQLMSLEEILALAKAE